MKAAPNAGCSTSDDEADRGVSESALSDETAAALAQLFRALADPNRTKIVHALAQRDMTTSGLATMLDASPPAVSQHLRLLRLLRLVKPRREGRLVYYSLHDRHVQLLISLSLTHLQEEQGSEVLTALNPRIGVFSALNEEPA